MAFLRADREERSREKLMEQEARDKERAEDMEKIQQMIIYGVKEEIKSVLQPLQDRLDSQDRVVKVMTRQFDSIMKEVEVLRVGVREEDYLPGRDRVMKRLKSFSIFTREETRCVLTSTCQLFSKESLAMTI